MDFPFKLIIQKETLLFLTFLVNDHISSTNIVHVFLIKQN